MLSLRSSPVLLDHTPKAVVPPAPAQVDQQRAQEFFKEAQALCERDGGRLWGVSLCGPMVFADRKTQTIATNKLAPDGPRPPVLGLVNAPAQWGGERWMAFMWDFTVAQTPRDRQVLFGHELFHRIQPQLGLMAPGHANEHVDAADGRYWLRLEWRALARALQVSGAHRDSAVRDALAFRQARRALYPGSAESERDVEITEGLAHYTGHCGRRIIAGRRDRECRRSISRRHGGIFRSLVSGDIGRAVRPSA